MLTVINILCMKYLHLVKREKRFIIGYAIVTQIIFLAWIYGQYLQLKDYL